MTALYIFGGGQFVTLDIIPDLGPNLWRIQVVTDNSIQIATDKRIIETVVPTSYKTKSGALNKARALQYCLGRFIIFERERGHGTHLRR